MAAGQHGWLDSSYPGEQMHMAAQSLDYAKLFAKDLPAGTQPWGGFPLYNFIGGHNNPNETRGRQILTVCTQLSHNTLKQWLTRLNRPKTRL
jgi:hypothetical protein